MHTVSIILPAYNAEAFLERTINGVLSQTYQQWELIIIDDCSTDSTREIITSFEKKDSRIKSIFLDTRCGEPAQPKNIAYTRVTGGYIAYLDHDDEWLPQKLEKQMALLLSSPENIGLVTSNFIVVDSSTNKETPYHLKHYRSRTEALHLLNDCLAGNSGSLFRKKTVDTIGPRDERAGIYEDRDIAIRILAAGYDWRIAEDLLFKYYVHGANITQSYDQLSPQKALAMAISFEYLLTKWEDTFQEFASYLSSQLRGAGLLYLYANNHTRARALMWRSCIAYPLNPKNILFYGIIRLCPNASPSLIHSISRLRYLVNKIIRTFFHYGSV
ncbi:MAG: glycosyltransferase [bacterium]|nr:glycosyltransferase [bacterium]